LFQPQLARFDLGEIQNVVDDAQQRLGRLMDFADVIALARIELRLQRQMVMPMMAFIGVRISWLILARKSDLACAAASACARAASSSRCMAARAEISPSIACAMPSNVPPSSCTSSTALGPLRR
jgi:hypothetical protein